MKNYWPLLKISLVAICLILPSVTLAEESYPRLANYYLSFFDAGQYSDLARWDLLVVQPEMVHYQAPFLAFYKERQPQGLILAYTYPAMFFRQSFFYDYWGWRTEIFKQINNNHWWLTDAAGQIAQPWPLMSAVNLTKEDWRQFNLDYLEKTFDISAKWDGVFFDMVDASASYYQEAGIDIDQDGYNDSALKVDTTWRQAMTKFLSASRERWPNKIIVINGNDWGTYQAPINGRMFESWPTPWQGNGTWTDSMKSYLTKLPSLNQAPQTYILNGVYNPVDKRDIYAQMRFGLASALLGDGYWSFDAGEGSHHEIWWFDEYNVDLGTALGLARNLLEPSNPEIKNGLWRRDFTKGLALVNAAARAQTVILPAGQFRYFKGLQDPAVNSGEAAGSLTLCPKTGIILLRAEARDPELSGTYVSCYDELSVARRQLNFWEKFKSLIQDYKYKFIQIYK